MKHVVLIACTAMLLIGCAKKNEVVLNPNDIPLPLEPQKEVANDDLLKVQIAKGEIRELLLALQRIHFSFNTSTLSVPARDALDDASEKLKAHPEVTLFVDGHTDNRGTTEYNLSLGERRAQTVVKYLTTMGVASERLKHVSFGEEKLLKQGHDEIAHAQNRRVDFRLMKGDIEFVLEEGALINDKGEMLMAQAD
jgi:peptidoglycan-associated lipoprotein